jgi:hypothetical protein
MTLPRLLFYVILLIIPISGYAADLKYHLDRDKVPMGCSTCHYKGNFKYGGGSETCVVCHGDATRLTNQSYKSMPRGFAKSGMKLKDIEGEFRKIYHHPTFDSGKVHRSNEELPETDPRAPRHAECVDCHEPHNISANNKFAGIKGKSVGNMVSDVTQEYELCYKCHAESANLPGRYTNKRAEFNVNNPSFHPVESEGKNQAVLSLIRPYREKKTSPADISTLSCSSCHGSESPSTVRGPHGSKYQYILVDNFSTKDNEAESQYNYALCYRCHERTSILGDESFKYHSLHIKGKGIGGMANGTSCYTCHNSHGSTEYRYLLKFNRDIVLPNSQGQLKFVEKGVSRFHGECYLSCHGVDHNPKSY